MYFNIPNMIFVQSVEREKPAVLCAALSALPSYYCFPSHKIAFVFNNIFDIIVFHRTKIRKASTNIYKTWFYLGLCPKQQTLLTHHKYLGLLGKLIIFFSNFSFCIYHQWNGTIIMMEDNDWLIDYEENICFPQLLFLPISLL